MSVYYNFDLQYLKKKIDIDKCNITLSLFQIETVSEFGSDSLLYLKKFQKNCFNSSGHNNENIDNYNEDYRHIPKILPRLEREPESI